MKNKKLNLVYDLWDGETPIPNGRNLVDKDYKLRGVEGLLNFYARKVESIYHLNTSHFLFQIVQEYEWMCTNI